MLSSENEIKSDVIGFNLKKYFLPHPSTAFPFKNDSKLSTAHSPKRDRKFHIKVWTLLQLWTASFSSTAKLWLSRRSFHHRFYFLVFSHSLNLVEFPSAQCEDISELIRQCSRTSVHDIVRKGTKVCRPAKRRDFSDYPIVFKIATIINTILIFGIVFYFTFNTKSELERKLFLISFTFSFWILLRFLVFEYYYHLVRVKE